MRNILLTIGGLLLAIAAVVFTVVTWSDLSIGARAAILAGATALVGYLPHPLHRHGMTATAETFGVLTGVFLGLDAFAAWTLLDTAAVSGAAYYAGAVTVLVLLLAGYPRLVPLRGPRVVALPLAPTVPVAIALTTDAPGTWLPVAFVAVAVGNLALLSGGLLRRPPLRGIAIACGVGAWSVGMAWGLYWLASAVVSSVVLGTVSVAGFQAAGLLGTGGAVAVFAAWHWRATTGRDIALGAATACWTLVPPAVALNAAPPVSDLPLWGLTAWAVAVLATVALLPALPATWRFGPLVTAGVLLLPVSAAGLAAFAPAVGQLRWVAAAWQGDGGTPAATDPALLPVLLTAVAAAVGWVLWLRLVRPEAAVPAVVIAGAGGVVLAAQWLPPALALVLPTVTAAALLLLAARTPGRPGTAALWTAVATGVLAVGWALATPGQTLSVLGALSVAGIVAAAITGARTGQVAGPRAASTPIPRPDTPSTARPAGAPAAGAMATPGPRPATDAPHAPAPGAVPRGTFPRPAAGSSVGHVSPVVAWVLAFVAATTGGATLLAGYAALVWAGLPLDPRWTAFAGLAGALVVAAAGRLPVLDGRPEQRQALVVGGLALVLASAVVGAGFPATLPLTTGTAALAAVALVAVRPGTARWAPALVAGGAATMAAATTVPAWVTVMFGPLSWLGAAWTGAGTLSAPASDTALAWTASPAPPPSTAVVLVLAGLSALALTHLSRPRRTAVVAVALTVPVLAPFPGLLDLPTWCVLAWLALLAVALLGVAAHVPPGVLARVAAATALWATVTMLLWSLAEPPVTLVTLLLTVLLGAGYPLYGRDVPVTAGATAGAVLATGGFAVALLRLLDQPPEVAALGLVAVVAAATAAVAATRLPRAVAIAAEGATAVLAAVAVVLTLLVPDRLELTSVVLATLGVIALAAALRADRRWLGAVGAVLLLAALWVALSWLRVTAPEPYLGPLALAALAVGWQWRRAALRARASAPPNPARADLAPPPSARPGPPSSWLVFGPGLALGLLPTLTMVLFAGAGPVRLWLLGGLALACVLVGARYRLQAPLLLGGLVLLVVVWRAFGEPLWGLTLNLPTWVPVGLVGLSLVAVGARLERNLRDLRRIGRALGRLE